MLILIFLYKISHVIVTRQVVGSIPTRGIEMFLYFPFFTLVSRQNVVLGSATQHTMSKNFVEK